MNQHYIKYDTLVSFHALPIPIPDTPIIRLRPDGLIMGAEMYRDYDSVWLDGMWADIPKLPEPVQYNSDSIVPHPPLAPVTYSHIEVKPRTVVKTTFDENPLALGIALACAIIATGIFICKLYTRYETFCENNHTSFGANTRELRG